MSIRRLLIMLLTLFGLLIAVGSAHELYEARKQVRMLSWFEQANQLADIALHASAATAMERGITAAILANPEQATASMLQEMMHQRRRVDWLYRNLMDATGILPELSSINPISSAVHDLSRSRGSLEAMRRLSDRALQGSAPLPDMDEWLALATRHIEILSEIHRAAVMPLPDNSYSYTADPVMKEVLFTVSEYAGRERAMIGAAIAAGRPLTGQELATLGKYRDIVELALKRAEGIVRQYQTTSELIHAATAISNRFLGSYEELRQSVYAASRAGQPYPVSAEQWYAEATKGIDSVLGMSEVLNAQLAASLKRLRNQADRSVLVSVGMLLLSILIFIVVLLFIRRRLLEPLRQLQAAALTIAGGDLGRPLPAFRNDELGDLAGAFERMRQSLLADIRRREAAAVELRKFSSAVEQSADSVIITDRHYTIEYVNAAFERTRGYRRDEVLGKNAAMLKSEMNDPALYQEFRRALKHGEVFRTILSNRRADGSDYWEEITLTPLRDNSQTITHYLSIGKDVSDRVRAEQELNKLSQIVEHSAISIVITDAQGVIDYVNPQFVRTTGYRPEEVLGRQSSLFQSGRTPTTKYRELWRTIQQGEVWEGELLNRRKNGEYHWEQVSIIPVHNTQGAISHFIGLKHDISQHKKLEEQLNFLLYYDKVTQLPNRNLLSEHFGKAAAISRQHGTHLALLLLDLSRFKLINDSLGHTIGDRVLFEVGRRLSEVARSHDTVARYGGDEYVIILSDVPYIEDISTLAQRMIEAVAQPVEIDNHELCLASHVGISVMPRDGENFDALLRNASSALDKAAREGRDRFSFYTEEMNTVARSRLSLEHDLRRAIEQHKLTLHYQPRVDFASGRITGVEALARWKHPEHGDISPVRFIPVAEETGLIMALGEWALDEACRQSKAWQQAGLPALTMAVNLSAVQLRHEGLAGMVARLLKKHQLAPHCLELELTESTIMEVPEASAVVLNRLRDLGVRLAVDDFGTGYSSLSHLRRFPFDTLKIDQSFVNNITSAPDEATIARTIIAMAHNLHLRVVAEGVQTRAQAAYLHNHGCDELQGYLFSAPVPANECEQLLRTGCTLELEARNGKDLKTLLLVNQEAGLARLLQRIVADKPLSLYAVDKIPAAFDTLALTGAGVVICDQHMPAMAGLEFLARVRELHPETVRIVVGEGGDQEAFATALRQGTIHRYFTRPYQEEAIGEFIDKAFALYRAIRAREMV